MIYSNVFNPIYRMLGTTQILNAKQQSTLTHKGGGNGGGTNDGGYIWVG